MSKTKSELIESIDEQEKLIVILEEKLQIAEAETRRFQNDASRESKNWKDCEAKLSAIRQVVTAELKVRHGVDVQPQSEWFNGKEIPTEDVTPDIRLLRHLHDLSNTSAPF